jgi:hypothetical protein
MKTCCEYYLNLSGQPVKHNKRILGQPVGCNLSKMLDRGLQILSSTIAIKSRTSDLDKIRNAVYHCWRKGN